MVYGYLKNISLKDKSRVEINDAIYCLLTEKRTSQRIRFIQGDMPIFIEGGYFSDKKMKI